VHVLSDQSQQLDALMN